MSPGEWVGILSPLALVLSVVITQRMARGAQKSISFKELADRLDRSEARERIRDNYIHELRAAWPAGAGEPPPWPSGLTT